MSLVLLKISSKEFSLLTPTIVACRGQALNFCKAPGDNFKCNRCYINKYS